MTRLKHKGPLRGILKWSVLSCVFLLFAHPVYSFEKVNFIRELKLGLTSPVDTAVSQEGEAFVLDRDNASISIFDHEGSFQKSFGTMGSMNGEFKIHFPLPSATWQPPFLYCARM